MSRIAKNPVAIPSGVEVKLAAGKLSIKGPKGALEQSIHPLVAVTQEGSTPQVRAHQRLRPGTRRFRHHARAGE